MDAHWITADAMFRATLAIAMIPVSIGYARLRRELFRRIDEKHRRLLESDHAEFRRDIEAIGERVVEFEGGVMITTHEMTFFLDRARNLSGKPIRPESRRRLTEAVMLPSEATWQAAHGVILSPAGGCGLTLWMALVSIQHGRNMTKAVGDPGNGGRWVNLPTGREVFAALRFATS